MCARRRGITVNSNVIYAIIWRRSTPTLQRDVPMYFARNAAIRSIALLPNALAVE